MQIDIGIIYRKLQYQPSWEGAALWGPPSQTALRMPYRLQKGLIRRISGPPNNLIETYF